MQALWWTWQAIGVRINVSVYWMRFKAWFSDVQISIEQKVLEDYLVNWSERAHCLSLQMLIFKVSGPITDTSNSTYTSNGIANCPISLAIVNHGDCRFEYVIRCESEDTSKFSLKDHIGSSQSRVFVLFLSTQFNLIVRHVFLVSVHNYKPCHIPLQHSRPIKTSVRLRSAFLN